MKTYAYIFIILAICCHVCACSSQRSLSTDRVAESTTAERTEISATEASVHSDSTVVDRATETSAQENTASVSEIDKSLQTDEYEEKKEVREEFDANGNLTARTTTHTQRGRSEQSSSRGRAQDASHRSQSSVGNEKLTETSKTLIDKEVDVQKEVESDSKETDKVIDSQTKDSRIVQGKEWLYVVIPSVVVAAIIYLIRNGRKKRS